MDQIILETEQAQLEHAQKLITEQMIKLEENISSNNSSITRKLEYAAREKIDNLEKAEVYADVYLDEDNLINAQKEKDFFNKIRPKPFFSRFDFQQNNKNYTYYVGVKTILDNGIPFVLDWRTPVCSLLYYSSLGNTYFLSPNGKTEVNLLLKRQFKIIPNKIVGYFDTNIKIDDNILIDVLSKNASNSMSNIVQTIQKEQNEIIRKNPNTNVIINGIAGSGKTSIAMHRLAYILFNEKGKITSKNILLLSPNKLFSFYVKDVLPELGEENVITYTIEELLNDLKLSPKVYGTKKDMANNIFENVVREKEICFKFSYNFKTIVDSFIHSFDIRPYIEKACENHLQINKNILYSLKIPTSLNIEDKLEITIESYLKNVYKNVPIRKIETLTGKIIKECKSLITSEEILAKIYQENNLHFGEKSIMGFEDVPVYSYIKLKLNAIPKNYYIKHIFIDEMQDYDAFTLSILKEIYPEAIFTLTGDYNQNVISTNNNLNSIKSIFPKTSVDNLDVSYRTTFEISTFANKIININYNSKDFIRHGEKPTIKYCSTKDKIVDFVNSISSKYENDKIALIAKTEKEAIEISKIIPDFKLAIDEDFNSVLNTKKIITTIYLSKGLEFDRVIIPNADKTNYHTELDKQNLFVSTTRALHGLYLYYTDSVSDFIQV